jgi:hypothetical protein
MSRREEASKLNSENIGPVKRIRPLAQALHVSSLCCVWRCRLAFNGVVTGNLTNAMLSLVDTISQNHPLMAGGFRWDCRRLGTKAGRAF